MSHQKTDYQPIDCGRYDYLEIACLHHYRLEIEIRNGTRLMGTAITTQTLKNDGEYLVIDSNGETQRLRLDTIRWLRPLDPHASFDLLEFTQDD